MKPDASRLSRIFEGISAAADLGQHSDALRLADSARRFAPENPTARLIHARSLLHLGNYEAAAKHLRGRDDADSVLLLAEAAHAAGLADEAIEACQRLLTSFAVDSVSELAGLAGRLCRAYGDRAPGWVGLDSQLRLVGELLGATAGVVEWGDGSLSAIAVDAQSPQFALDLPESTSGEIRVREGNEKLLGSGLRWPLEFRASGWVVLENRRLVGEVLCPWDTQNPSTLIVAPGRGETRHLVAPAPQEPHGWPFSLILDDLDLDRDELEVVLLLPDGRHQALVGSPLKVPSAPPRPIAPLPSYVTVPTPGRKPTALVHIIVPVYAGVNETLTCLRSVLATAPAGAVLTVIDDASPDEDLRSAVETLARRGRFTLIRNEQNLGFPGAVNRGLRLHPERDVVILNADTEVFAGWVERLASVAYGGEHIGTVTPLGQAASIMTYGSRVQATLSSAEAARVDRMARQVNNDIAIDLPVGVGFCLYIRRACLNDVGEFDERGFARGYGEENDLCLRARRRGWRHVGAPGVFVRHVGGLSFGRDRTMLMRRNDRVLNYRYPGYDALVAEFIKADPLRRLKRAVDAEWLIEAAVKPVLLVTLELAGGVKRHVAERRAALEELGHTVLMLRPDTQGDLKSNHAVRLEALRFEHLIFALPQEFADLERALADLNLVRIEIHHFLGMPGSTLDLLVSLGVPYRVVIHDYTWVCPRVAMLNGLGVYCGEPDLESCEACVQANGSTMAEDVTVAALRARSTAILEQAERVTVPTEDVRRRMRRYVPDVDMVVEPWEPLPPPRRRNPPSRTDRTRVLLIGAIDTKKGYSVLLDCARDAVHRQLPLEFVIIGYSSNDQPLWDTGRVFMTGPYEEHEVNALLDREGGDVAWFPTVGPETWCYTLTYALAEGLPIVAFDLGAVAERLRDAGLGVLMPLETPPETINDELLRVAADARRSRDDETRSVETMAATSASETEDVAADLSATVQVLNLPVGLYAFTVQSGTSAPSSNLLLPALQISPAPVRSAGVIEFLSGPATLDRWLTAGGDVVMVKVSGGDASLLLTSLRNPQSGVLSVDVRRLDAPSVEVSSLPVQPVEETRVITLVHVPYLGDLTFVEGWAGKPTENLWIEGFSVLVEEPQLPELVEYCGVSEHGDVTDWVTGGELCGARGTGVPLVAFALRVRQDVSRQYTCRYRGRFLSGTVIGPFDDGRFCRSEAPGDPLVAMELLIKPGAGPGSGAALPR